MKWTFLLRSTEQGCLGGWGHVTWGTQMMDGYSRVKVSSARRKSAVAVGMWFVRERKKWWEEREMRESTCVFTSTCAHVLGYAACEAMWEPLSAAPAECPTFPNSETVVFLRPQNWLSQLQSIHVRLRKELFTQQLEMTSCQPCQLHSVLEGSVLSQQRHLSGLWVILCGLGIPRICLNKDWL